MVNEERNILQLLIENKDKKFSIRKISLLRKINYKSAYLALQKLSQKGLIDMEHMGNSILCSFSNKFAPLVFEVEYSRKKNLLKNKDFKAIYGLLRKIEKPFVCLLFGSAVNGKVKKGSDIDIFVISENSGEIEQIVSLIPLDINLTAITYKEFFAMAKSREFNVLAEAMRHNIILVGIEEYYRLAENAQRGLYKEGEI